MTKNIHTANVEARVTFDLLPGLRRFKHLRSCRGPEPGAITRVSVGALAMGVDAYQTHQTSRTTFSAAFCAAPVTILTGDMALPLGQVSTSTQVGAAPKEPDRTNNQIPPLSQVPPLHRRTLLSPPLD